MNYEKASGESNPNIDALLKDARQQLVETGTRNRLVHVNRSASRANVLNIVNERSDDIFSILKTSARKMRFKATGRDKTKLDNDAPVLIEETTDKTNFDASRYTDNQLETPLGPDAQQKRLLRLFRDAKTAEEEQGINILYLAMGFLTWFEDKASAVKREAPLILLPVELVRNNKTSTYDLKCLDDDIVTNMSLQEKLRTDFGIELPEIQIDEDGWSPSAFYKVVHESIESRSEWSIDENGMQLGFFSFAKLLMLRDLDPDNWPSGGLNVKPLIKGLLASGFNSEDPLFNKDDRLDDKLAPIDIIQVVDADASQTKVIEEVRSGRNLVVQGPPGTGKSQTITNIIASAVHDGKKVLFVAEKMAALSVVHNRLVATGLGSMCLELHSRAANKKRVIAQLAKSLNDGLAVPAMPSDPNPLTKSRNKLNEISNLLHSSIQGSDETPFTIISELVHLSGKNVPPPSINGTDLAKLSSLEIKNLEELLGVYSTQLGSLPRKSNPLYGVGNLNLQPMEVQRLNNRIVDIQNKIQTFINKSSKLVAIAHYNKPNFLEIHKTAQLFTSLAEAPAHTNTLVHLFKEENVTDKLQTALEVGGNWRDILHKEKDNFIDSVWDLPISHLRAPIASAVGGFFSKFGSNYRTASRELATLLKGDLPKNPQDRVALVDTILAAQRQKKKFDDSSHILKEKLGSIWREEKTPFSKIAGVGIWKKTFISLHPKVTDETISKLAGNKEALQKASTFLKLETEKIYVDSTAVFEALHLSVKDSFNCEKLESVALESLIEKLSVLGKDFERYGDWVQLSETYNKLKAASLTPIIERIDEGELTIESARNEIRSARAETLFKIALSTKSELQQIRNFDRHELVDEFREYEKLRILDVTSIVQNKHLSQMPSGSIGEMGVIRGEIGKKRRHKSVRNLMEVAGSMIQRIKPVMLLSPISVAQYLPPEVVDFDMLIIDEASQVRPEDALGAIARAKQIVVVGDQKQLPPTSFFSKITGSDDNDNDDLLDGMARATEMESILSLCEARSIPSRMLEWHYRSKDPSLIRVSNAEFYDNNLVLPPSPLENDDNYGFKFTKVNGVYSRRSSGPGSPATNKIEAQTIAAEVAYHSRHSPDLSLGIVTFSMTQRNMVTEILEFERRADPVLDAFLREGHNEDVFVKNIENVQGDERDVILVSVGYGPIEAGGRLTSMSFGPVNSDGGSRRLNVLFSRARVKCEIFCSFEPGDIDLNRTTKEGPRILKRYLEFAKTGLIEQATPTGAGADSPFEDDVADEIRNLGYEVDHQIGSSGFLIDLGVKHPIQKGQYMLAVECDGATYHSALWARERDRLRQEVLENLGWHFHRIWSTDWFYRRPAEIERLKSILGKATTLLEDGISVIGANEGGTIMESHENAEESVDIIKVDALPSFSALPYIKANFSIQTEYEPHEVDTNTQMKIVKKIVGIEGPIHEEEIARRFASVFSKEKAGRRILEATKKALINSKNTSDEFQLFNYDKFWFTAEQKKSPPIRNRSAESSSVQKAEMISSLEIDAAILKIHQGSGAAESDEIIKATAKLFGFNRVGPGLKSVIGAQVDTFLILQE